MKKYLFNFAVSFTGGGYKRLYEYSKWFNERGGSIFIINIKSSHLAVKFKNNKYYFVDQSPIQRLFNDCKYLQRIVNEVRDIDLYYSYGIPIYEKIAVVNWFHLSNVLPVAPFCVPMSLSNRVKFIFLGIKMRNGFQYCDIISAESQFSLNLIDPKFKSKLFLSVNGSDDELSKIENLNESIKENIALVIGTQWYKTISESYKVYKYLKEKEPFLRLVIIGNDKLISKLIKTDKDVDVLNSFVDRNILIGYLEKCKYYISTTRIENSYNAASEGIFFADESFISDIGPHRELLRNIQFEEIEIPKCEKSILHVKKFNLNGSNLKSWNELLTEMIDKVDNLLRNTTIK